MVRRAAEVLERRWEAIRDEFYANGILDAAIEQFEKIATKGWSVNLSASSRWSGQQ